MNFSLYDLQKQPLEEINSFDLGIENNTFWSGTWLSGLKGSFFGGVAARKHSSLALVPKCLNASILYVPIAWLQVNSSLGYVNRLYTATAMFAFLDAQHVAWSDHWLAARSKLKNCGVLHLPITKGEWSRSNSIHQHFRFKRLAGVLFWKMFSIDQYRIWCSRFLPCFESPLSFLICKLQTH